MTTVRVGPDVVNAYDILEYADALIEEHGWRQGARVPNNEDWSRVAKNGLSLHDSIGMACWKLSGEAGAAATPARASTGRSKDFPTGTAAAEHGYVGTLREAATKALEPHLGGKTDVEFNDAASDVGEVRAVLQAAIKDQEGR